MHEESSSQSLNVRVVERIRIQMAIQRVSQAALADTLGRSQAFVSERLTLKTPLRLYDVEEIARALGIPAELLLVGESPAQQRRRSS